MPSKYRKPRAGKPKTVKNLMKYYKGVKDRPSRGKARVVGKYTNMGLFQFLSQMFLNNEKAERCDKLTNDGIAAMLSEEFPSIGARLKQVGGGGGKGLINYYRDLYNRGRLTNSEPPPLISYRYNSTGLVVDLRLGTRLLSVTERADYARKFFGVHNALRAKKQAKKQGSKEVQDDPNLRTNPEGEPSTP